MPQWPTAPFAGGVQEVLHAIEHLWVHVDRLADQYAQDLANHDARINALTRVFTARLNDITERISTMSATVEQVSAEVEAVRADIALLATDLSGIAANIAALEAKISAGSPNLDQVLADVSSLRVAADAAVTTATAMATPPAPVTP